MQSYRTWMADFYSPEHESSNFDGLVIEKLQRLLNGTLAVIFIAFLTMLGFPGQAKAADDLSEIRTLLTNSYGDTVSTDVLQAQTVDQMLSRLGDQYTVYFNKIEYKDFQDSLKNQFSGLGVHMNMVSQGVEVVSVIPGSPAESAGLEPGDIITRADERPLGGLTASEATAMLRGAAGTSVNLVVLRGSTVMFHSITRQVLTQPEISAELLDGHIGYLQLSVFGNDTPQVFGNLAKSLQQQGANVWIIDLRDNPGGYLEAAVNLAGYFIPNKLVVQIHDRNGYVTNMVAPSQDFKVQGHVFVLTNENSASAAEILSAALKDHGAATLLGENTFGKGSVQGLFDLKDGGALKMTVAHFYSPNGTQINHVGVKPDLEVNPEYAKEEAELFLANSDLPLTTKHVRIYYGSNVYTVSLDQALTPTNWPAWQDIVTSLNSKAKFQVSSANGGALVSSKDVAKLFPLSYPGYLDSGIIENPPLNRQFSVPFTEPILATQVTNADIQLVDAESGDKLSIAFQQNGAKNIKVIPKAGLQTGRTYWLVVNPSLKGYSGNTPGVGSVTIIHT